MPKYKQKFSPQNRSNHVRCFVHEQCHEAKAAAVDIKSSLDWKHVLSLDMIVERPVQCTICLEEGDLVVPVVTPCGHVFCLHCMMRLYIYTERDLPRRKCPVCNELIHYDELRSVRFQMTNPKPKKGQRLDMALVMRGLSSHVVALSPHKFRAPPLDSHDLLDRIPHEGTPGWYFSHLVKRSWHQQAEIIVRQILRLERFKSEMRSSGDPELVEAAQHAITYLETRVQRMVERHDLRHPDKKSMKELSSCWVVIEKPELLPADEICRICPATLDNQFYFYQSIDGRPIFVSSFLTKCLLYDVNKVWKDLPAMLTNIRVDYVDEVIVNEQFLGRYGAMRHLPLGLPILILDVDVIPMLSKDAKDEFREQLQQRKNKLRDEERRRKRKDARHQKRVNEANEEHQQEFLRLYGYDINPQIMPTEEDFVPLGAAKGRNEDETAALAASLEQSQLESESQDDDSEYPSFAQMLSNKRAAAPEIIMESADFPSLGGNKSSSFDPSSSDSNPNLVPLPSPYPKLASSSTAKPPPRTAVARKGVAAWGTSTKPMPRAKAAPTASGVDANRATGWDSDPEEGVDPELKKSYAPPSSSDAMWAAADQIASALDASPPSTGGNGAGGGRGKKKSKGKTIRIFG